LSTGLLIGIEKSWLTAGTEMPATTNIAMQNFLNIFASKKNGEESYPSSPNKD
jgi:hypothetical protein